VTEIFLRRAYKPLDPSFQIVICFPANFLAFDEIPALFQLFPAKVPVTFSSLIVRLSA